MPKGIKITKPEKPVGPKPNLHRQATIVEIIPMRIIRTEQGEIRRAEICTVRDETGQFHFLVTGSINGIYEAQYRKVGQQGIVDLREAKGMYSHWHFSPR